MGDGPIRFWLRKGVRWSDGHPFTVEDIFFWHENVLNNQELTPVVARDFQRGGEVMAMEKVDAYTVRFRFRRPNGPLSEIAGMGTRIRNVAVPGALYGAVSSAVCGTGEIRSDGKGTRF